MTTRENSSQSFVTPPQTSGEAVIRALMEYMRHKDNCTRWGLRIGRASTAEPYLDPSRPCDCGLESLLSARSVAGEG